ncbi:hypothetical protein COY14_03155 [Candidatus Roizmanbacteria bacterium CG_4_10_14_0_2_um_filter_36_9]|uniref:Uncharacterized protein n=1 Tax=Candidatus Roizmanbacteria bacterium CG_4_10_14_0_2_um_filter_36_9 TaxID=1974823 RepID=A0A2M7U3I2_9BACT|nr:MAG: hypothetical protein COY14_03155 [Candidatus Roizmanbacteria bacterium CG_4_10_14_0_2_um_filter_36_9]
MVKNLTVTLNENELLFLFVVVGLEDEEKYLELGLNIEYTTKERLDAGRSSLLSRDLIKYEKNDSIPIIDEVAIGLVGTIVEGKKTDDYYIDEQTGWKAKVIKEGEWYVITGEGE